MGHYCNTCVRDGALSSSPDSNIIPSIPVHLFSMQIDDQMLAEASTKFTGITPLTKEAYYYRQVFDDLFPGCAHLIPYYWMPKWSVSKDPSARTLGHYVQ